MQHSQQIQESDWSEESQEQSDLEGEKVISRLHMEEVLIALSASSITNGVADYTLQEIPKLRGAQVHTTVMLSETDERTFQRLGVMLTSEPK